MNKRFLAFIIVAVVLVGAFFLLSSSSNGGSGTSNPVMKTVAGTTSHYEGNLTSKVTFTEYGDFQCPVCGGYFPTLQQVEQKYASTVRFQFRNLPLTQIHQNAFAGARAAEAADLQGKYWQMHDLLYENQDTSGQSGWVVSSDPLNDYFVGFAKQIGLNTTQFKTDFASSKVNNRINADISSFSGSEATPTFFLNGKYVANSTFVDNSGPSLAKFSSTLDAALKTAK
jgi:protein-disulfide isomerase